MRNRFCLVSSFLILLLSCSISHAAEPDVSHTTGVTESYEVAERGKDHTLLRRITNVENDQTRAVSQVTNQFTLLENCLNYLENGVWKESEDVIESFPEGAIATRGPNKAIFSPELNTEIVFDIQASDGKRLAGGVRGIQLTDIRTGRSVVVGSLRESVAGRIIPPNQILYADAFSGIKADVLLVWKHNFFGHEVVLREQPQLPEGWEPANTRLEVLTEFYPSHEPELRKSTVTREGEPPVEDDTVIHFGALAMVTGKALPVEEDAGFEFGGITSEGVSVIKQWHSTEDERHFLIESVSWQEVREGLSRLPVAQQANNAAQPKKLNRFARTWPTRPPSVVARESMLVANVSYQPKGFLVDFTIIPDEGTPNMLSAGTYYIKTSYYNGNSVTFNAGCVIKFKENAYMLLYGPISFPSSGIRPVFTSRNDDSVAEVIQGVAGEANSDGNPSSHQAAKSIWIYYSTFTSEIRNAHIRWSKVGIQRDRNSGSSAWLTVSDCFFQNITGSGSAGFVGDPAYVTATNLKKCNVTTQGLTMTQDCIRTENSLPGDSSWALTSAATSGWPTTSVPHLPEIEGFASATSVNVGGTIQLYVDVRGNSTSQTQPYTIKIYRMGWYGGVGGQLVQTISKTNGRRQPIPTIDYNNGMVDCLANSGGWTISHALTIPTYWVSGVYLAKLTDTYTGKQSYIIFVVREDSRSSDLYFQSSVTTYQAYNPWGGQSMYNYPIKVNCNGTLTGVSTPPATKVSFNRPYAGAVCNSALNYGTGAGEFLVQINFAPKPAWEYNALRWMEKLGYDLTYCSSIDTHLGWPAGKATKAFVSVGHDEYWSALMRANVESKNASGVNLAFLGANNCYWKIAMDPGERSFTCAKQFYVDTWRAQTGTPNHEMHMMGVEYFFNSIDGNMTIPTGLPAHWAYDFTGLVPSGGTSTTTAATLTGLLGYEIDGEWTSMPKPLCAAYPTSLPISDITPAWFQIARTDVSITWLSPPHPANCAGTFSGRSYAVVKNTSSTGNVFSTGSMQWCWGLDDYGYSTFPSLSTRVSSVASQITHNMLRTFAGQPRTLLP